MALASNYEHFTPPRAACQIRHDLGFLPILWAEEGDMILVDNKQIAIDRSARLGTDCKGTFITRGKLREKLSLGFQPDVICPWGWDVVLQNELLEYGISPSILPDMAQLDAIRQMSHRRWAAEKLLLPLRQFEGTVGESYTVNSIEEVQKLLSLHHSIVLKAPWSSSGRGIRYVGKRYNGGRKSYSNMSTHVQGWIKNVLNEQGSVMVEPWYDKLLDVGMEFYANADGSVNYLGLSLFHAADGTYEGNLLGSDSFLMSQIARYVSPDLLQKTACQAELLLSSQLGGRYQGPLGIDMMVVQHEDKPLLQPCVELNLRSTMGHVALALSKQMPVENKAMRITFETDYQLIISSVSQP